MDRSDNRRERVEALLKIYSEGRASRQEEQELFDLIDIREDKDIIQKHIKNIVSEQDGGYNLPVADWELLYQRIMEKKSGTPAHTKVRKIFPARWAAAAAVVFLFGTGYYFLTVYNPHSGNEMTKSEPAGPVNIEPPASANAVLTLANGQTVILDSAGDGTIVRQGAVAVVKLADGQIAYRGAGGDGGYNTLNNPRGSKVVSITLADGSKVWLNAASTIRYPVAFTGRERRVEISGEAYFEVAHNPARPFIVRKGATEVKVLGTHFNVEAYDDERTLDVTLLEGSVSVAAAGENNRPKMIRPGEQAQVAQDGTIALARTVDLNEVMAWKDNMFSFNGADIEVIMRQVSRWYNVEVVLKKPVREKFYAEVSKNTNIATLLEMLEATKAVHFRMEGGVIVVTP